MYTIPQLTEKVNAYIASLPIVQPPQGLYQPVSYVLSMGGKRLRPVLMLMACNLYQEEVDGILSQAAAIETYHNYTLLHDDLMDRADRRRGKATVHKVWGDNTAILSGDAMLVMACRYMMDRCPAGKLAPVMDLFCQTALEICEGQQYDMDFESRLDVTEDEYLEMIRLKTSVLLAASLKIGALLADAPKADADALYDLGMNMGVAFQLRDDLLDVYGDPAVFGKNIGGDILCNKKTYMLIRALECADDRQRAELNRWLTADACDPAQKIAAVTALYDDMHIRRMCEEKIADYSRRAHESLQRVDVDDARKASLSAMLDKLMDRKV